MGEMMNQTSKLPQEFFDNMKAVLGGDYDDYIAQLDNEPYRGLRVNTLKCDDNTLSRLLNIEMTKTPFCEHGYYISNEISGLGNHPLHHAGAFYLQEPSAMSAVTALDVHKGDKVLDLCAAPGGKSTQIAAELQGEGLLVSNEIVSGRAKILASNLERMGAYNAVITNAHPEVICGELQGWFDKVLVDAPCSGEGMIRREAAAVSEWRLDNHEMCAERSAKILDSAAMALKSGGIMVYSTCTLSAEENERTVDEFLNRHPEFSLVDITAKFGRAAYPRLCGRDDINKARRIIYPDGGEGHFVAKLQKRDDFEQPCSVLQVTEYDKCPLLDEFLSEYTYIKTDRYKTVGDTVYILPQIMPKLCKTRIIRAGIEAGEIRKNRFSPSHGLYMATAPDMHKHLLDLDANSEEIRRFLHGEVIGCSHSGYTAVAVNGITVGFGKASNGQLKNHYPKGLRTLNI